jgi:tripartite-type tricarboxylate transporter receptor subunit TctC
MHSAQFCFRTAKIRRSWALVFIATSIIIYARAGHSASDDFFKGKTINLVVGFSPGGGFDLYSRLIARHMGKYIPGNPGFVVQNMTGAGSLIAANHVYNVATPDGLTIGNFIGTLVYSQILERPGITFDARKFEYIGVPLVSYFTCALTKIGGVTTVEDWRKSKTPVKIGGLAPGSTTDDIPKVLHAALGLPLRVVSGYKGTSEMRLAAEQGEIHGACWGWESMRVTWAKAIESGDVAVVIQMKEEPHPDLRSVPLAVNLARSEETRRLIRVGTHDPPAITFLYSLPPGTPKDRVAILRRAFTETMKDAEFLEDARKSKLDISPLSGEVVEKTIHGLFKLEPSLLTKLKEILK